MIIGVHSGKFSTEHSTESIRQTVMRLGVEHPVVNDAEFKIWNAYTVNAWPTLVLIDPRGRIAGETSGEILADEFASEIQEVIDQNRDLLNLETIDLSRAVDAEPERPLRFPARLLISGETLFIADTGHHRIVEVGLDADGLSGEVQRVFGTGLPGLQDGAGQTAMFNHPHGLGLKGGPENGTLYVADTENHAVRAIRLDSGEVTTVAGTGQKAHGRLALGQPAETPLRSPWAVLPLEGYVFIAMAGSHQIWVLIDEEQLGPFAGNGYEALVDGPVANASFNQPSDLAYAWGYIFVADAEASAVRAISLNEAPNVQTLVGQGLFDFGDQDGSTSEALLQHTTGLAINQQMIYIADTYNHKIKQLDPVAGLVQTLLGSGEAGSRDGTFEEARLFEPEGLQVHQGRLYIADTNNHHVRVADLDRRTITTFHLKGLERLPIATVVDTRVQFLPAVTARPGRLSVTLDVRLPEGHHRNVEMPAQVIVGQEPGAATYTFTAAEEIGFPLEVHSRQDIPLNLTLYYCQDGSEALCLIHSRKLMLPVNVDNAAGEQVSVPYMITA